MTSTFLFLSSVGCHSPRRNQKHAAAGMSACGDDDMRGWLTLVLTTLCLAGAFSLAYRLAAPYSRDFAPFVVFVVAALAWIPLFMANWLMSAVLPVPWAFRPEGYRFPPRKVRVTTRAVFRLPAAALLSLGIHTAWALMAADAFESRLVLIVGLSVIWVAIPLFFATRLVRQYRLMRLGDSTMAHIERRDQRSQDRVGARLQFNFEASGRIYSGWGRDHGYHVPAGSLVPIFFEAKNPTIRLLASESYFEVAEDETRS
jgi:hypothetical protein